MPALYYPFCSSVFSEPELTKNGAEIKFTKENGHFNVSVLAYTKDQIREEQSKELKSEGNYRQQCHLDFDCIYNQKYNHHVTADMFYSMDAVIVGMGALHKLRADITKFNGTVTLQTRKRDQIWVGHSLENSLHQLSLDALTAEPILNQLFNWTIFLSRKATIEKKFGYFYKKLDDELKLKPRKELFLQNKRSKDFCWFITQCDPFSIIRTKMVQALIEILPSKVHLWGHAADYCVNNSTKHPNVVNHGPTGERLSEMSHLYVPQMLLRDCKFYFAFDNSNCTDFVSQRFISAIVAGAIPIVWGRRDTYNEMLPGSFIHLSDFSSLSQLSKYLESLLKDEKKLNKYQEWRQFYIYEQTGIEVACKLCRKLEKLKRAQMAGEKPTLTLIPDLAQHYRTLQECTPIKPVPI
ncbi:alpha-(1,3)-fucosyltransferase 4-like isoform X2 [Convolutriloba macropyga]|uniref:alpha-(1,3)-fucosyltransferase 4-like isoform X2 n=1 Tax=Convolutriloba macropyga TaxID=536237 RepID=UPI003F525890